MIILDTNVVSELMRLSPNSKVADWVAIQNPKQIYTTAINEAELRRGIEILPAGRRRQWLLGRLELMFSRYFLESILPFDSAAAHAYAVIVAARRAAGRSINEFDCQITAIAFSHGASIATRDMGDFQGSGVRIINPWLD